MEMQDPKRSTLSDKERLGASKQAVIPPNSERKARRPFRRPKAEKQVEELNFLPNAVGSSSLTLWHRPKVQHLIHMKEKHKVTMIITALADREKPNWIRDECKKLGLKWFHIPLNGANKTLLSTKGTLKLVSERLVELLKILASSKERALLHCAAGIHRTGVLSYTLLRCSGFNTREKAMEGIKKMRQHTHDGVKDWRIDLAEEMILPAVVAQLEPSSEAHSDNLDQPPTPPLVKDVENNVETVKARKG